MILQQVWGTGYGTETQYLRVYASQLRKKLGEDPARPRLVTEPGVGYRLVDRDATITYVPSPASARLHHRRTATRDAEHAWSLERFNGSVAICRPSPVGQRAIGSPDCRSAPVTKTPTRMGPTSLLTTTRGITSAGSAQLKCGLSRSLEAIHRRSDHGAIGPRVCDTSTTPPRSAAP